MRSGRVPDAVPRPGEALVEEATMARTRTRLSQKQRSSGLDLKIVSSGDVLKSGRECMFVGDNLGILKRRT